MKALLALTPLAVVLVYLLGPGVLVVAAVLALGALGVSRRILWRMRR